MKNHWSHFSHLSKLDVPAPRPARFLRIRPYLLRDALDSDPLLGPITFSSSLTDDSTHLRYLLVRPSYDPEPSLSKKTTSYSLQNYG